MRRTSPRTCTPASTWRFDPSGRGGPGRARPPPRGARARGGGVPVRTGERGRAPRILAAGAFWEGLAERRERHGFLVIFDEVVTGVGRTGTWLAAHQLPMEPDIVAVGKGLGAGHAPLAAVLCRQHVYDAIDAGSREFDLGHTWDGAPLPSAVGLAVLDLMVERGLVDRVRDRGPALLQELTRRGGGSRDRAGGPRSGVPAGDRAGRPAGRDSFLPVDMDVPGLVDDTAFEHGVLVTSTHPQADGFAGDQVLLAPAFTSHRRGAGRDGRAVARAHRPTCRRAWSGSSRERPPSSSCSGFPDVNGSIRGKALRPDAFESAVRARDGDDRPAARRRPGRRADHRLRPVRHPNGRRGPHRSARTRRRCTSWPGDRGGASAWRRRRGRTAHRASWPRARCTAACSTDRGGRSVSRSCPRSSTRCGCGTPPAHRCRAASATASWRSAGTLVRRRAGPALEGLGIELTAVHTEAGPGLLELNLGRPARSAGGRRRRAA